MNTPASPAPRRQTAAPVEPSLGDLLGDPLLHLVLRRDGLTPDTVARLLEGERRRLAATRRNTFRRAA